MPFQLDRNRWDRNWNFFLLTQLSEILKPVVCGFGEIAQQRYYFPPVLGLVIPKCQSIQRTLSKASSRKLGNTVSFYRKIHELNNNVKTCSVIRRHRIAFWKTAMSCSSPEIHTVFLKNLIAQVPVDISLGESWVKFRQGKYQFRTPLLIKEKNVLIFILWISL